MTLFYIQLSGMLVFFISFSFFVERSALVPLRKTVVGIGVPGISLMSGKTCLRVLIGNVRVHLNNGGSGGGFERSAGVQTDRLRQPRPSYHPLDWRLRW